MVCSSTSPHVREYEPYSPMCLILVNAELLLQCILKLQFSSRFLFPHLVCWGQRPPLLLSGHNCSRALALAIKPLLCHFPSPIGFGISGSSMGCKILQVVSEPGRSGIRVTGYAFCELRNRSRGGYTVEGGIVEVNVHPHSWAVIIKVEPSPSP